MSPEAKIDDLMQSVAWLERRLDKLVRQVNKMEKELAPDVEPPVCVTHTCDNPLRVTPERLSLSQAAVEPQPDSERIEVNADDA